MGILKALRYYLFDLPVKRGATLDAEGIKSYNIAVLGAFALAALFTFNYLGEESCDAKCEITYAILGGIFLLGVYGMLPMYYGYFNRDKINTLDVQGLDMGDIWTKGLYVGIAGYATSQFFRHVGWW